jgi:4-hydroxy-2-oxoheptanedioate aldolase
MKRFMGAGGILAMSLTVLLSAQTTPPTYQGGTQGYKAKRTNKAIELLEAKQPVWFTGATGERDYADGKKMASTYADYIDYPLEHEPFDMEKLRRFMQGLADGGPTRSGHRTPAVIATLPVLGISEAQTRAGDWMVNQVLAAGVHGIMFCRARNPGSVRAILEAGRWPFHKLGLSPNGLQEGYRGSGSQTFAAKIWGMSSQEYMTKSDWWPLNPNGELLLGLKMEDRYADDNATEVFKVPGVGFAEYGPGDAGLSYEGLRQTADGRPPSEATGQSPTVLAHRGRILAAAKAANVFFMDSGVTLANVDARVKEGAMISRVSPETADKARRLTLRQMPW